MGWRLALDYIGGRRHPSRVWLNNYGNCLLEPFSPRWFYGDSIFIIDLWIWIALGVSVWLSLRRERRAVANWQRPAWIGFTVVCGYILANGLMPGAAERMALGAIEASGRTGAIVFTSPAPLAFW